MPKVKVEQGWLEGELLDVVTEDGQYYSFKGIPYAAPPVGKLRFKAPQPPQSWDGVRKATEYGGFCPINDLSTDGETPGNEDCLFLNVYTPHLKPTSPLAVMVYIHGGGYMTGCGNDNFYGPDFLVQHNVVLVTLNYRFYVLGFLCLDTKEVPGNAGLKDQVAALQWVQRNIENFGGDPNNVTIFGESLGGLSVSLHDISPMSKGLFKRGIAMSGVPLCDWASTYEPRRRAFALGKQLGINTEDTDELLEFLQKVPLSELLDKKPCIITSEEITSNNMKMNNFMPVVEKEFGQDRFLNKPPLEALKDDCRNGDAIMLGYTSLESLTGLTIFINTRFDNYSKYDEMFVPQKILRESSLSKIFEIGELVRKHYFGKKPVTTEAIEEFVTYASDSSFVYPVNKYASCLAENTNKRVYLYQLSCVSERNVFGAEGAKYGLTGAAHLDDVMYLFHSTQFNIPVDKSLPSYRMIQQTCTLFTNFAKYGNPTPQAVSGITWPMYDNVSQIYLDIGEQLVPGTALGANAVAFFDRVFEISGVTL